MGARVIRYLLGIALTLALTGWGPAGAGELDEPPLSGRDRSHWAFVKPLRPVPPVVKQASWLRGPVDAFILARLEKAGLKPAPAAERAALLRRVTFDLTGLPPTPDELDAFLGDAAPNAYERVVERLLAAPHYGEHWAQHWLDVVRYAESNGYETDGERPHAWRYRDYVIRSFNADKPYDEFVTEQVAGDQLAASQAGPAATRTDLLVATGFQRCGPVHLVSGNTDAEVNRQEVLTEMTGALGSTFLGLTIGCARCHNHKFDPLSQADYYRLQAFFAATQPKDIPTASSDERRAIEARKQELEAQLAPLRKQVADMDAPYQARLSQAKKAQLEPPYRLALDTAPAKRTPEQARLAGQAETLVKVSWDEVVGALTPTDRRERGRLRERIHALEAQLPPPPAHAWAVVETPAVPPTFILKRGDPKHKGSAVQAAFPRILQRSAGAETGGPPARLTRLDLARWLTRADHPLTARVLVNRLWQYHFGRGLVATPNDWGLRGQPPSHPELLDWLACEFVAHGWSIKHMQRLLVLSNTYRQASRIGAEDAARRLDPDNQLLGHMPRRRLQAEALRDNVLAVTGTLNRGMGGPMVRVPLEPEVYDLIFTEGEPDGLWPVTPDVREHGRRSIYLFAKRNVRLPLLEAFDQPDTLTSCPVRPVSTFAPQALILLNGPFMQEQSKQLAGRLLRECGPDTGRQVARAYRLALGREPQPEERQMARDFLAQQTELLRGRLRARERVAAPADVPEKTDPAAAAALVDFCLALCNRNEFVSIP